MATSQPRQRHRSTEMAEKEQESDNTARPTASPVMKAKVEEEAVWGKTPAGKVFRVPTTHDVLSALFHPKHPKSHIDLLNLFLLGSQILIFSFASRSFSRVFFLVYFAFWRAAYDAGLGWVLTQQSKRRWVVREVERRGWLDEHKRPKARAWIRAQLQGKMGKDYSFDELPLEYNTWLLFRQLVDIILLNDFVAYCMFAFACFRVPTDLSPVMHAVRWLGGLGLIGFNLWVKTEAHNVVKDYGWYWGDVFFARGALVFDGVFELAPHPMYSVGYAGYYGLSLIVGSYAVLFVSLAAHAAQFAFLVFFENPHIERAYGQRKLLAQRTPLARPGSPSSQIRTESTSVSSPTGHQDSVDILTPSETEGDTATESESDVLETETETEESGPRIVRHDTPPLSSPRSQGPAAPRPTAGGASKRTHKLTSQHDVMNFYFRKDPLGLVNLDPLRVSDLQLILLVFYTSALCILPAFISLTSPTLHFVHALFWTLGNTFGLGLLLKAQGERKHLVRHFLKHYHYPANDGGRGAISEAFANWKGMYNLGMCMTYASAIGVAWRTYQLPHEWWSGFALLEHTFGILLVGLHIWASTESYQVLGPFGWFFADFFVEHVPASLDYTGIYRYLNNPEILSGAAFFGMALITRSKMLLALAVIKHVSHWWFLSYVEHPHMRKLYGDSLRKEAGFVKVMKKVASSNAKMFETRAGRHAPAIRNVAKEFKGTFDKVYEETAEAVEEFLSKSKPRLEGVVQDTKFLLQQSRERLIITRVATNVSNIDTTKYQLSVVPSTSGEGAKFHLGEPIRVNWTAPTSHSRKDWIGIYRLGANSSKLITKTSSLGMWVPVHDEEWDGDVPVTSHRKVASSSKETESGQIVFKGDQLPWNVGKYEIRYHHDGKYNVMTQDGPIEIYVDQPSELDFPSVRATLLHIVTLCLDSDPSLLPLSIQPPTSLHTLQNDPQVHDDSQGSDERARDPDDFRFWSERQASRISQAIEQAFGVEYAREVIMADANVSALANRILVSKEILSPGVRHL